MPSRPRPSSTSSHLDHTQRRILRPWRCSPPLDSAKPLCRLSRAERHGGIIISTCCQMSKPAGIFFIIFQSETSQSRFQQNDKRFHEGFTGLPDRGIDRGLQRISRKVEPIPRRCRWAGSLPPSRRPLLPWPWQHNAWKIWGIGTHWDLRISQMPSKLQLGNPLGNIRCGLGDIPSRIPTA